MWEQRPVKQQAVRAGGSGSTGPSWRGSASRPAKPGRGPGRGRCAATGATTAAARPPGGRWGFLAGTFAGSVVARITAKQGKGHVPVPAGGAAHLLFVQPRLLLGSLCLHYRPRQHTNDSLFGFHPSICKQRPLVCARCKHGAEFVPWVHVQAPGTTMEAPTPATNGRDRRTNRATHDQTSPGCVPVSSSQFAPLRPRLGRRTGCSGFQRARQRPSRGGPWPDAVSESGRPRWNAPARGSGDQASWALATSTRAANPASSWTAMSARTLRSISTSASFRPWMNWP